MIIRKLHWLHRPESFATPVSFGIPFARGTVQTAAHFDLKDGKGRNYDLQTKVNATWPDGSVKWLLASSVLPSEEQFFLTATPDNGNPGSAIHLVEDGNTIHVENGLFSMTLSTGNVPVLALTRGSLGSACGKLYAYMERNREENGRCISEVVRLNGCVRKLIVEENGPVRAVIRMEGRHCWDAAATEETDLWKEHREAYFPFTLRIYIYAGSEEIRMVHTFGIDLDQHKDLLKGMSVELEVPTGGEEFNRHIGFTGDTGMFYEGAQPRYYWMGELAKEKETAVRRAYHRQITEGKFLVRGCSGDEELEKRMDTNAVWNRFLLRQRSADSFEIAKQTEEGRAMVRASAGHRSLGSVFYGNEQFILQATIQDMWEKAPRALEVTDVRKERTRLILWLYSKYEEAYDFSEYDIPVHRYSYEASVRGNDPVGICNTNEIFLHVYETMPGKEKLMCHARDVQQDRILLADPKEYGESKVFGSYWYDIDYAAQTDRYLKDICYFYEDQKEERSWYGFWDYGDVMHTYDTQRHSWRYDVGGFAWNNTELCNTYVYWIAFLRLQDPKIYRLASRMSRHCSEVEIYHFGENQGLGTRHNVRHWGCSCKEPRISMAGHYRFFYYLTGDERTGEIMDLVRCVGKTMRVTRDRWRQDPYVENDSFSHLRIGPDWTAFLTNFLTSWERHQDTVSRDKILNGIRSIAEAPMGLASGSFMHYNDDTGEMRYFGDPTNVGHTHEPADGNYTQVMEVSFGGPETFFELDELLEGFEEQKILHQLLINYGHYAAMTPEERKAASQGLFSDQNMSTWGTGVQDASNGDSYLRFHGFTAVYGNHPEYLRLPQLYLNRDPEAVTGPEAFDISLLLSPKEVLGNDVIHPVHEVENLITNGASQGTLNYLESAYFVKLARKKEDEEQPLPSDFGRRGDKLVFEGVKGDHGFIIKER